MAGWDKKRQIKSKLLVASILLCCAILFSLFTVFYQATQLTRGYLETIQVERHVKVLQGIALRPLQYRILSEYLVEGVILALTTLGLPHPTTSGFILFRIFQNIIIFLLAAGYYKKLGLNTYVTLVGLTLLAWAMTHSLYDSDLVFNTYSDVIFYLAAGLLILHNQHVWIIPIVGLAALNRETSGLIPFMLVSYSFYTKAGNSAQKRAVIIAAMSSGLYAIIFVTLRYLYSERPLMVINGYRPGLGYFVYNVSNYMTYVQLFATLGVLPFMALFSFRQWPCSLRAFFWAVVPIWLLVHPFLGAIAESRYFLVPLALIFIPGTLFGIVKGENRANDDGKESAVSYAS